MAFLRKKLSKAKVNLSTLTVAKSISKFHFDVTVSKIEGVPLGAGEEVYLTYRRNQITGKTGLAEVDSDNEAMWDSPQVISVDAKFQHAGKQLATEKNLRLTLVRARDRSQMGKVVIKLSEMVSVNPDKEFSMLLKNTEKYRNTMPGSIHLMCKPTLKSIDGRSVVGLASEGTDETNRREVNGTEYELGDIDEISNSDMSEMDADDDEGSSVFSEDASSPVRPSKAERKLQDPAPIPLDDQSASKKKPKKAKPVISITPDHPEEDSVDDKRDAPVTSVSEGRENSNTSTMAPLPAAKAVATPSDQESATELPELDELRADARDLQVDVQNNVTVKENSSDSAVAKKKNPIMFVAPVAVVLLAMIVYFLFM